MAVKKKAATTALSLEEALEKINKRAGYDLVVRGDRLARTKVDRLPSGSLTLDEILGGGWAAGRWHEVIGAESSGKTALCLSTVAANQARDPNFFTVWVDSEDVWEDDWVEKFGVDRSRVYLVQTNQMVTAFDAVIDFMKTHQVDLVVIDSLPSLVPPDEEEADSTGDAKVAAGARLIGKFTRVAPAAGHRDITDPTARLCTVVVINQWREKIGVMPGADPRVTPGGKAKNYTFSTRTEVARTEWIDGPAKRRVGIVVRFKTIKNKTAPPQQLAESRFYFSDFGGVSAAHFDVAHEAIALAKTYGLVAVSSGGTVYRDQKWRKWDDFYAEARGDVDLQKALIADVREYILRRSDPEAKTVTKPRFHRKKTA